jgi:hypothetical protein
MAFPIPTRSPETEAGYLSEGMRHFKRARRLAGACKCDMDCDCAMEALCQSLEPILTKRGNVRRASRLKPRTVRRYRQEIAALLAEFVRLDRVSPEVAESMQVRIWTALDRRRGRPRFPRTATLKVKDLAVEEIGLVQVDLVQRALSPQADLMDQFLPPFLVAAPVVGPRPVEWIGADFDGTVLVLPVAKYSNGRGCSAEREMSVAHLGPELAAAIRTLLALLPDLLRQYETWPRLRNALAERLARACVRVGVRRLSLYSLRHCALATWKASGLSSIVIAALAGHASLGTQETYAGPHHGWDAAAGNPEPDPDLVAALAAKVALSQDTREAQEDLTATQGGTGEEDGTPGAAQLELGMEISVPRRPAAKAADEGSPVPPERRAGVVELRYLEEIDTAWVPTPKVSRPATYVEPDLERYGELTWIGVGATPLRGVEPNDDVEGSPEEPLGGPTP